MPSGTKFYSDKQEKLVANYMSSPSSIWKQVTGSGARPNYPGDVVNAQWLGECKTHTVHNTAIIFIFSVWEKIKREAAGCFKKPALFTDDGSQDINKTYVMVEIDDKLAQSFSSIKDYTHKSSYRKPVKDINNYECIKHDSSYLLVCKIQLFKQLVDSKVL